MSIIERIVSCFAMISILLIFLADAQVINSLQGASIFSQKHLYESLQRNELINVVKKEEKNLQWDTGEL